MDKLFKYINGDLHGYKPSSVLEKKTLIKEGWFVDPSIAYEAMGEPKAKSDKEFIEAFTKIRSSKLI